jgi:phosphate transport system substrate-binding protein
MPIEHRSRTQRPHAHFIHLGGLALLGLMFILSACGSTPTSTGTAAGSGQVCPSTKSMTGGGSTFVRPFFAKVFSEYATVGCHIQVNYQSIGSGAGKTNLLQDIVAFGATDTPMTDAELAKSTHGPILHIPVTLGTEAISYNLKGLPDLKFTGPLIADIYLGKVTFWDDAALKQINPGVNLPHQAITVAHRSDGSGTTGIFTQYLSTISPEWKAKVGSGTTVSWPVGVGGKGNEGVAATLKNTSGAIGYIELAYAIQNSIPIGSVQNQAGKFLKASLDGGKEAAANITTIPDDLRFFIVNAPGDASYPISGFSWAIVYQNQTNVDRGKAVADMLWYVIHDGQQYATQLNYAPLADTIVSKAEAKIKAMMCGGSPCYTGK